MAVVALLALAGGVVSDTLGGAFWDRHALLAGLTASVIIVMLSVAILNEVLERGRTPPTPETKSNRLSPSARMAAASLVRVLHRALELGVTFIDAGAASSTRPWRRPTL